ARMDDELTGWLDQVHQARRIDENLSETRAKRKSLSRIAEDSRDAIFRFLALNDAAPPRGRADSDALAEGLQKIERRTRKD
ncbi:MAG: hypothetical protein R3174_10910, partial [Gammaproteobacteria bacterium]|nr:hypothetical protein [Gammaproteobacteria bacterium]